jgi:hypothetical protein
VLPISAFNRDKDGWQTYCRACGASAAARWRKENPDRSRATRAQWGQDNPIALKAKNLRRSAHKAGPSDIGIDWIMERLDRGVCELTGIPFVYEWRHPFLPSIDRIDATQPGHMKDNCRVVLWGLNAFKGTASEEVFLKCLAEVSATPNRSRQSL